MTYSYIDSEIRRDFQADIMEIGQLLRHLVDKVSEYRVVTNKRVRQVTERWDLMSEKISQRDLVLLRDARVAQREVAVFQAQLEVAAAAFDKVEV